MARGKERLKISRHLLSTTQRLKFLKSLFHIWASPKNNSLCHPIDEKAWSNFSPLHGIQCHTRQKQIVLKAHTRTHYDFGQQPMQSIRSSLCVCIAACVWCGCCDIQMCLLNDSRDAAALASPIDRKNSQIFALEHFILQTNSGRPTNSKWF